MKQLFKENFTSEQIQNIFDDWNNKGVLYGWEDIEASKVQKLLEQNGYNLDSIKVMRKAFDTLYLLNREGTSI
ncbi:hypothetical protein [Enterococcus phage vB_EfaS_Ef5.1]|nr:hypothetical protein [Enterococcus phage vB_EfaS_Ef5.1]